MINVVVEELLLNVLGDLVPKGITKSKSKTASPRHLLHVGPKGKILKDEPD
jgi:hypothetical protein